MYAVHNLSPELPTIKMDDRVEDCEEKEVAASVATVQSKATESAKDSPGKLDPTKQANAWSISAAASKPDGTTGLSDDTNKSNQKPVSFASIMAEQTSQLEERKAENTRSTRVKFSAEVESEEERQMRLAIEASLRDQQHDYIHLEPHAGKKSALKNGGDAKPAGHVSFSANETTIAPIDDDMDEDMKMAIALSLQESGVSDTQFDFDERKPSAVDFEDKKMPALESTVPGVKSECIATTSTPSTAQTAPVAAFASAAAASANSESIEDESEKLARALHDAEIAELNSQHSANAAAEEASLKLAMMLQQEEDDRLRNNLGHSQYSEAARIKREDMCRGGSRGGVGADIGVRTVNREEFHKIKSGDSSHFEQSTIDRIKAEEKGMGRFLLSKGQFNDDTDMPYFQPDTKDYDVDYDDGDYEEYEEEGIRMNPQSAANSASWKRLDKNTFVGSNNEIRTKHDPALVKSANANKLKDAYSIGSSVSDSAYNSFKRAEARQIGMKKGVARQAHGRAENMNATKTRGGAMDGGVRLKIAAAINQGLIERCNGVVKEGKEALVYHAEGVAQARPVSLDSSDGYDVAVKVFKRISEFKGRGMYVDGDPRFHKQKFKSNDQREQVVLWAEKEYRNLIRAHRGGVKVPVPLRQKENVLFMRFLGDNGWPSPQLREVEIKKGSDRWTVLYCQTIAAIRRLYHCARLVHADLSEYNILLCPSWQLSKGIILREHERSEEDQSLVIVLIDFGQAVEREHPSAKELLRRDIQTVRDFFVKQGIAALPVDDAEEFILAPFTAPETEDESTLSADTDNLEPIEDNNGTWRHNIRGWDDQKVIDDLLAKLQAHAVVKGA